MFEDVKVKADFLKNLSYLWIAVFVISILASISMVLDSNVLPGNFVLMALISIISLFMFYSAMVVMSDKMMFISSLAVIIIGPFGMLAISMSLYSPEGVRFPLAVAAVISVTLANVLNLAVLNRKNALIAYIGTVSIVLVFGASEGNEVIGFIAFGWLVGTAITVLMSWLEADGWDRKTKKLIFGRMWIVIFLYFAGIMVNGWLAIILFGNTDVIILLFVIIAIVCCALGFISSLLLYGNNYKKYKDAK